MVDRAEQAPTNRALSCAIPDCLEHAGHEVALPLCPQHIALAAELSGRFGVSDLLPDPCVLCGSRLGMRYPTGWACAVCEWPYGEHPDAELPPPRIDIVYYLRYGERVKIGTTVNPRQRFAAIWHDEVLAFERGNRRRERQRHERFASDRAGTSEWFHLSPAIREHVDILAGGCDPWDSWARWRAEATAVR